MSVSNAYDSNQLNRLIKQASKKGTTVLSSYTYTLYPNGQRKSLTEHTGRKSVYAYDKLGRLTAVTITDAVNGNHTATYTFDKVGNCNPPCKK